MIYGGSLRPLAFTAYTWKWYSLPDSSGGILNWGTVSWILTNGANVACARCRRSVQFGFVWIHGEGKLQTSEREKVRERHKSVQGRGKAHDKLQGWDKGKTVHEGKNVLRRPITKQMMQSRVQVCMKLNVSVCLRFSRQSWMTWS